MAFALLKSDAALLFKLVWPVSAAAIGAVVIRQALHRLTVTFDEAGLQVHNQPGPLQWRAAVDRRQVTGFARPANMFSNNTPFYRVRSEDVYGKKQTLATGITDPAAAQALVARLETWRKAG